MRTCSSLDMFAGGELQRRTAVSRESPSASERGEIQAFTTGTRERARRSHAHNTTAVNHPPLESNKLYSHWGTIRKKFSVELVLCGLKLKLAC